MGGERVTGVLKMKSIWETGELAALSCQQPKKDFSRSFPWQRPPREYVVLMCRAFPLHCYKHPLHGNAQLGMEVSTIFVHGLALSSAARQCSGNSNRFGDPVLQVPALVLNQERWAEASPPRRFAHTSAAQEAKPPREAPETTR